ncbi:MAG: DEAD/DEAH box helicase [Bacteroidaceae bacterium]|nr:DEAD/DEAH box helicase [Bacteroidaceae bacterium]
MQEEMLSSCRRYDNVVLLSPTGSGKTLAYLLALSVGKDIQAGGGAFPSVLILVPSRELAVQTRDVATKLYHNLKVFACYGGRAAMEEHRVIREMHPDIIVGTPGRVLDHIGKDNFATDGIGMLVIDEFDKSLELGFRKQMQDILIMLPNVRRRILLSATDSADIPSFVGIDNVHKLDFTGGDDYEGRIRQWVVRSPQKDKLRTLSDLLCCHAQETSMVFLGFRDAVGRVADWLSGMGFTVSAFHGGMEQKDRERALFKFECGAANILVCTDLAGRGLDIAGVDNIIHYHLPVNKETLVHRNGRTARWDKEGNSFLITGPEETVPDFVGDDREEVVLPGRVAVPAKSRWEVLYIGRGKKDKVNKVDVVGFLSKIGGLQREQLGMVRVFPSWSFAAVERRAVRDVLNKVRGQKIKGQKTIIEPIK